MPGSAVSELSTGAGLWVGAAQEGVALFEDPVVLGADPGEARLAADEEIVEVAAALGRLSADEGEVLGGEQDELEGAEDVAGAGDVGATEPGAVGLARLD